MSAFTFVRGFSIFHSGIDLAASRGTPVHAVAGGSVIWAGSETAPGAPFYVRGGGNVVVIAVAASVVHLYAHLDTIRMTRGATVSAGALVGAVGTTGNSTGPHLHFAIWVSGKAVNPNTYYTTATLIAAVSGTAPGGGNVILVSTTGDDQVALLLGHLRDLGIPTTPTHKLTHDEAVRLAALYDTTGNVNDAIVRTFEGMTVQELMDKVRSGDSINTSPFDPGAWVNQVVDGLGHLAVHLGQGLFLAILALMGIWLLLRSSSATRPLARIALP